MTTSPIERAAAAFATELARWRVGRGLTKKQLAAQMGFDPSYVSHVERMRHRPTEDFARRAELVLQAEGAIWRAFVEYDDARTTRVTAGLVARDPPVPEQWLPPGTGLVVERELASLTYQRGHYRCVIRRSLYNASTEPVTRYLVRVAVDRFPQNPDHSNAYHRAHPLRLEELDLRATCGEPGAEEPMWWHAKQDRDASKEIWLLFENDGGRFPLYPGHRATIEYGYTVGADKWGPWFQRAVRLPTRRLAIRLDFPAALDPQVWGVETSLSAEEAPLRTPVDRRVEGDRVIIEWATDSPGLHSRYRLQWRFRPDPADRGSNGGEAPGAPPVPPPRASRRMHDLGIVQRGADILRHQVRSFRLPNDASTARQVIASLRAALGRVQQQHVFSKGVGLAAPQIDLPWAAAIVRPAEPTTGPALVLLNPRVISASPETDEQYEGCLSFFDVRGLVRRPLVLEVEHVNLDGAPVITVFERGAARLVAHEIDHLAGRLYTDLMPAGAPLVPVEEYGESGQPWVY
jgi:peptide deformylase